MLQRAGLLLASSWLRPWMLLNVRWLMGAPYNRVASGPNVQSSGGESPGLDCSAQDLATILSNYSRIVVISFLKVSNEESASVSYPFRRPRPAGRNPIHSSNLS